MVLEGPERIALRRVDAPEPAPGLTAVAVGTVGICGTDLSIFHGTIPVDYPRIIGHEIVGRVEHGGGDLPTGTRVLVDPTIACGSCRLCREGRSNLCTAGWLLGRDRDGGLGERVVVPSANLHVVPESVSDRAAPSIQMLSTCLHGQAMCGIGADEPVAVVGLGVTGLMHVQLAAARGATPIVGVTRSAGKRALAERMGATHTVAADDPDGDAAVREITGDGAATVIECAGTVATLARSVRLARPGATILAYGTITAREGAFPYYDLYYKELTIVSPRAATEADVAAAVDAAASGAVDLEPLVTDVVPLEQAGDALAGGGPHALKTVVDVSEAA